MTQDKRFPFQLDYKAAQRIIDIACLQWKEILASEWGAAIVLHQFITIDERFYKNMREACTPDQHRLFDEIFGKDEPEIKFEKGTILYFQPKHNNYNAKKGDLAKVLSGTYTSKDSVNVEWLTEVNQMTGGYGKEDFRLATPQEIEKYEQSKLGVLTQEGINELAALINKTSNISFTNFNKIPSKCSYSSEEKAKAISKLIYDTWCKD